MNRALLVAVLVLACCGRDRSEARREPPPVPTPDALPATVTRAPVPATAAAPLPIVKGPKLRPQDEASKDPSLLADRARLLDAVRRHDVDAVVAAADPKIRTSFGEGGGPGVLRTMLQRPELWSDLEQILTHGGTFREETFWAPYVYSAWPEPFDAFTSLAVIADGVPLRASPGGAPVAMLAYDVVGRVGDPKNGWQEIRIADGRTGFVEEKFVRSPIGYRAGFAKRDGTWRMTALVAGD